MNDMVARPIIVKSEHRITPGEKVFLVIALIFTTGGFLNVFLGFDYMPGAGTGTFGLDILWASIFAITFILLRRRGTRFIHEFQKNPMFLLLVGLPFASTLWSVSPHITFFASFALLGTAFIALYISLYFTSRELLDLLAWTIGICGACSVLFVVFIPSLGIGTGDFQGQWQGIYSQKNALGRMMAIGFVVFLLLFKFVRPRRLRYLLLAGFMFVLVCLSQSATSLVVCVALPIALWGTKLVFVPLRHPIRRRTTTSLAAIAVVWMASIHLGDILNLLGRDEGLTGRTTLWALVAGAIVQRPLLGYGYEAFWRGNGTGGVSDEIWNQFGQFLWFSHNGLLEVLLALGLVGGVVVVGSFLLLSYKALRAVRQRYAIETMWPVLCLAYLFIVNITDDYILKFHSLPTILFLTIVLGMRRDSPLPVRSA